MTEGTVFRCNCGYTIGVRSAQSYQIAYNQAAQHAITAHGVKPEQVQDALRTLETKTYSPTR